MEEPLIPSISQSDELSQRVGGRCNSFSRLFNPFKKQRQLVGAGLGNLGNTCFLNVILQCITHTVPLIQKLRSTFHPLPCFGDGEGFCTFCAFKEHVEISIKSTGSIIWPEKFRDNLSKFSSDFVAGEQADAHEYLRCFLDSLNSSSLNPNLDENNNSNKPSSFEENGIVKQIFGGRLKSQLKCGECGHRSDTFEPFLDLSLEIDDSFQTLENALHSFTKTEVIEDTEVLFTCEGCKTRVSKVEKQMKLDQAPDVLAVHLKRFKNDGSEIEKIDKHVEYPIELDLEPFVSCSNTEHDVKYELYGIVEHRGVFSYGHYVSTIRSSPSSWHLFNDSVVTSITEASALNQTAYILFYIKKGTSPWFSSLITETLTETEETSEGSPVSVFHHPNSDDDVSPNAPKPAPAAQFKEERDCGDVIDDTVGAPKVNTPPRSTWIANLDAVFDYEDLPEDKEDVHFVPKAQTENSNRPKKPNKSPVLQNYSPAPSSQVLTNPKKIDYNLNSSLRGMNSKRRNQLLDCLRSDSAVQPTKKRRSF
ncbi:hypothetical protein LUZ60_016945 [Juncus effusus]|nr:hypothetical protein LUZ60_016945 [Juncus effusus]